MDEDRYLDPCQDPPVKKGRDPCALWSVVYMARVQVDVPEDEDSSLLLEAGRKFDLINLGESSSFLISQGESSSFLINTTPTEVRSTA